MENLAGLKLLLFKLLKTRKETSVTLQSNFSRNAKLYYYFEKYSLSITDINLLLINVRYQP